jgi:hypothetical protein
MLVIRAAQMAALQQDIIDRFKLRLYQYLMTFLASKGNQISPQALRKEIDTGMVQRHEFGMDRQCDVARLFEIVCGSGHSFAAGLPKDALNILWAYRVDPELKLTRLAEWAESAGKGL